MNDPLYRPYWPYVRRVEIRRGLRVAVPPNAEPISIDLARQHLRLDADGSPPSHPDDELIETVYLPAAREACEQYLGASLAPQTLELSLSAYDCGFPYSMGTLSGFGLPREFYLPFGPVLGVESVTYTGGGVQSGFTDYVVDIFSDRIRLAQSASWPTTDDVANPIVIRYPAGYSTPGASPQDAPLPSAIITAILLTLTPLYLGDMCQLSDLPPAARIFLDPYKRRLGFA